MSATGAATGERVPPFADRELVAELAARVVERVAPDELVVFDEVADEYFRDPRRAIDAGRRDQALGFGLDLTLVGPYALAVAGPVVQFLGGFALDLAKDMAKDAAKDSAGPTVRRVVRRMFAQDREDGAARDDADPIGLSAAQVRWVWDSTRANAVTAGLPEDRARMLADAIVGSLHQDPS